MTALRVAANVPVVLRLWVAGLVVLLDAVQVVVEWNQRWLWWEAQALVPWLSSTGVASVVSLIMTLGVVLATTRLSWRDFGLTPRQISSALGTAALLWTSNQVIQLIDAAWAGASALRPVDYFGAFLSAYSEEVLFRMVLVAGIAAFLAPRMRSRRVLPVAMVAAALVFAAFHIPHDLAEGYFGSPIRYPALIADAVLLTMVYLQTGNLLTAALFHLLGNEPMLVVAGRHGDVLTVAVRWLVGIAVVVWQIRSHARAGAARSLSASTGDAAAVRAQS